QHEDKPAIPYTLSAKLDYTRGTVVAQRIDLKSGKSSVALQGRINEVLTKNILGRLEYRGTAAVPFLNYFFLKETFAGSSDIGGSLELSKGRFYRGGTATAESVTFEGWNAQKFRGEYSYHYPERRLVVQRLAARILDGSAAGNITIEPLPGASRVSLDLEYT